MFDSLIFLKYIVCLSRFILTWQMIRFFKFSEFL